MSPRTEAQKKAQLKWIEKNKDTYAEHQRFLAKQYYENNKEEILQKKKIYYQNKKAKKLAEKEEIN